MTDTELKARRGAAKRECAAKPAAEAFMLPRGEIDECQLCGRHWLDCQCDPTEAGADAA